MDVYISVAVNSFNKKYFVAMFVNVTNQIAASIELFQSLAVYRLNIKHQFKFVMRMTKEETRIVRNRENLIN